jgi:hypothetical protein
MQIRRFLTLAAGLVLSLACAAHAQAQDAQRTPAAPAAPLSPLPIVRVTMDLDSGVVAHFDARDFELRVGPGTENVPGAELRLVKQAGAHTGDLVRLGATGARAPSATVEVLDSLGIPSTTLRLGGVVVASDRVSLSAARASLEQQRLSQQEALSALNADWQEAQRQLATVEALGKSRIGTRQDLERARDRASDLQHRIELVRKRQALAESQLAAQGPLEETVVLRFDRLEIVSGAPGGTTTVELAPGRAKRASRNR